MLDGGAAVVSLDARREARRARRQILPYARRGLLAIAIGTSILGGVVLLGVVATALTPHSTLTVLVALGIAAAAGWPLTKRVTAILDRSQMNRSRRAHPTARPSSSTARTSTQTRGTKAHRRTARRWKKSSALRALHR